MIHLYDQRAATHTAAADVERRRSLQTSRLRLLTFLPAAAAIVWMLAVHASAPLGVAIAVLLLAFGALVVRHARIEEKIAWLDASRIVNERGLARVRRDWNALPSSVPPPNADLTHHPYAIDLDLFGRASLTQWLGPSATLGGYRCLASWLLEPASIHEIRSRQGAVRELAAADVWREEFFAHGVLISQRAQPDLSRFLDWAEGPAVFGGREHVWRWSILALTLAIWILLALQIAGVIDAALWMIPLVTGMVLSFSTVRTVQGTFDRAGAGQHARSR